MPVLLPEEVREKWLDPEFQDPGELVKLLKPLPARALSLKPVNPAMGNVKFEGPDCILPPPAEPAAVTGDAPRTRKPRAEKGDAPASGNLFTAN